MSNWVTIYTFSYPHEAAIIQGRLEADGIETFLKDELTVQTHNFYSNAIGGIKLQVWEEDVEVALAILAEAGYVLEQDAPEPPMWLWLEGLKERIPVFKSSKPYYFLMLAVLLLTLTLGGIGYLIMRPSTADLLRENKWCVNYVVYKGVEYNPYTAGYFKLHMEGECSEQMIFYDNEQVVFPGFNTTAINGRWYIHEGQLRIKSLSAYSNIYNDLFTIEIDGDLLTLTSENTTVYAYKQLNVRRRYIW